MKKICTTLLLLVVTLKVSAQGWPEKYDGVMLQGFYWDSYADSKWTNLESQADEMAQFFNLIWVPNSAYANATSNNMGYHPVYWFDHKSAFGKETELRSMIKTFKAKNVGIIEDVVINHRASVDDNWLNFAKETYNGVTYQLTAADICSDDESKDKGYTPTGAKDTGEGWDGARDLDHTGANVQKNVNAYLDFLLNDLGYAGFRYDYVKGFAPKYVGQYNTTAQPKFSVGECWDGNKTVVTNWIDGTKQDGVIQSAAFDFPMKYKINDAFTNSYWEKLKEATLCNDASYARYAVTFVDNHDTYRDDNALKNNICAANAFILTMPGTPCVFLSHWKDYKGTLKKLIKARKIVGIHNQSEILESSVKGAGYILKVKGTNGTALLLLGSVQDAKTEGFQLVIEGRKYKLYVSDDLDISAISAITDTDAKQETTNVTIPSFCTVDEGETCAFFEAPESFGSSIYCWCWDNDYNYTTNSWPGAQCKEVGTADNGKIVYKWTFKETDKKSQSSPNKGIIFSGGSKQTGDMMFVNGGYYLEDGVWDSVLSATGIQTVRTDGLKNQDASWYDLNGRRLSGVPTKKGVYIYQGKKILK